MLHFPEAAWPAAGFEARVRVTWKDGQDDKVEPRQLEWGCIHKPSCLMIMGNHCLSKEVSSKFMRNFLCTASI